VLLETIEKASEIGFSEGQPVLACITFRSLLHWRGLTLVHLSAQHEPFLTQNAP